MHNNFKLKEYETKLTKTIESIPHPLLIADASGTINFVNTEFENIFGYSLEEIENEKIEILYPEGCEHEFKKLFEFYIKNSAKKMRIDHYLNFESKNKENITVGVSLNSFYDNDNLNIIVILEDLTIAKQHQDTILNQNDVLKKIAWKHSHEIRKPVANILGLSDLFDEINLDNETNYKTISYLKEAARELDLITQSIVEEANNSEYDFRFKKHKRHLF
jgi:PAS domain S-box-containing protein